MGIVLVNIHGIGEQTEGYDAKFEQKLKQSIPHLNFVSCTWQQATQPSQCSLLKSASRLKWKFMRGFMISYAADALGYQIAYDGRGYYQNIHARVDETLSKVYDKLNEDDVVIIVAHSLGSIIMNNFIWDMTHNDSSGNASHSASEKARAVITRMQCLITLGCPMAIWSLQHSGGGKPINVNSWVNINSSYDVIGYPLKLINADYAECDYIHDVMIDAGPIWQRFTPLAHIAYHNDGAVVKRIVAECLKAEESVQQI